jgi:hypothetical protein
MDATDAHVSVVGVPRDRKARCAAAALRHGWSALAASTVSPSAGENGQRPSSRPTTKANEEPAMNAKKNAAVSQNVVPAGPQPLADEDLGTVAGGHCHERKHRTTRRRTSWYRTDCDRESRCSRYSRF